MMLFKMNLNVYLLRKSIITVLFTCFLQIGSPMTSCCRLGLIYFLNIENSSKSLYHIPPFFGIPSSHEPCSEIPTQDFIQLLRICFDDY